MVVDVTPEVQEAVLKIQIEYVEMPQLKLTARQVQRLWSVPMEVCQEALAALIRQGLLVQSRDGVYVRHRQSRGEDRVEGVARGLRAPGNQAEAGHLTIKGSWPEGPAVTSETGQRS
jgi:hypothetical protein